MSIYFSFTLHLSKTSCYVTFSCYILYSNRYFWILVFLFYKIWKVRYLFSISVTFVLKLVLQTETVILGILFSISIPSISSATQLVPGIWFAIPVSVVLKLDFLTKPLLRTFLSTYSIFFLYVFYQYCIVIC